MKIISEKICYRVTKVFIKDKDFGWLYNSHDSFVKCEADGEQERVSHKRMNESESGLCSLKTEYRDQSNILNIY